MTVMPTPDAQLSLHWAFVVQWREGTTLTPEAWPTPAEPVPVGFATGLPIGWNSSTGPTSGQCLNYVNFGLDSVSTAVETASAATSSSSGTCSLVTDGRGPAATAALHNAFVAENAAGEAFYALGAQGHAEACTPFTSKMAQGATEAVPICNHLVAALSGATNPDLRACGDSAVPPVPPLYAAGEHHFILPHEVAPMGAAEVIAFEEVRASKPWDTLRQQLHARFDHWLDTLPTDAHRRRRKEEDMKKAGLLAIGVGLCLTCFALGSLPLLAEQQRATPGKSDTTPGRSSKLTIYTLDANASGVIQTINNIANLTVVSRDANDLKAEYRAGFIQGKLQGQTILSARDNTWDNAYLADPSHTFPKQHTPTQGPTQAELHEAAEILNANYAAFLDYLVNPATDADTAYRLKRLLFRMLGIYHGASLNQPASLNFSGAWLPDSHYLQASELTLGYETAGLTFMDIYFLNASNDLMDVISFSPELAPSGLRLGDHPDHCSAFLKRSGHEVILAHNSWMGFLSQTMSQTLAVNGDLVTFNAATPGLIGSITDFGYNNKGIMFNETTHRMSKSQVKPLGLWIFWRAALAEQFSGSITDFFHAISLDNTGTYLNGYMLVDAKTNETGLVEMSYRCFVYYRSTGGSYTVSSASLDGAPCATDYDTDMVTADYLMGMNYPASLQVRSDLQSTDNRPARRQQFNQLLPGVHDVETAKTVITYTDPDNPLSVFGRWDLGYGETAYPKQIPDGSADAKVGSASMVRAFMGLSGVLDTKSSATGFWMLYGTAYVNGTPFIWSESSWKWQTLRDVPDRLDGRFTLMPLYLR